MSVFLRIPVFAAAVFAAANLHAAPVMKALWLRNGHNTNSVKPAIDMLADRIGMRISFEVRDVTSWEKAGKVPDEELKKLHGLAPDFVIMSFGEDLKCKTAFGSEMTRWIDFFRSFRSLPCRSEMVMCGNADERNKADRESNTWRMLVAATSRAGTDFLMTGDLDREEIDSRIADILHARTFPRIVPLRPKLSEIDPATGEIELYYPGRFPKGRAKYIMEAGVDGAWRASASVGEDGRVRLRLGPIHEGAHSLRVQLTDLTVGHRPAVSQSKYQICAKRAKAFDAGRRLNNLVTELYAGVPADGEVEFVNPRDGYVAFVVEGDATGSSRPAVRLDGAPENIMPGADGVPMLAMRWLPAGRHVVAIGRAACPRAAAYGGMGTSRPAIAIRAVKAIRNRDANGSWSELRRRFVIPYANIGTPFNDSGLMGAFGGGSESNGLVRLARNGCRLMPSVNMDPHGLALRRDVKTVEDKIRNSIAWRLGMDVGIDENRVGVETEYLHHYTMAEAVWRLADPAQSVSMFWAGCRDGNRFGNPEREASEIAAISNSGGGEGLHIFETYQRSVRNATDVERQFDDTIACMRSMVDMVPASKGGALCYFGTYYFPGSYTPLVSPCADHRVLLDMWVRRIATDPSVADMLAGIGSGSYHYTDEEMIRWIAAIIRHYAIDGRTDSLAEKCGFKYNPGFVANPDFDGGLAGWTARPAAGTSLSPLHIRQYGGGVQGRKGAKGEGDGMALLVRDAKAANSLSQKVAGLVPGKHYALVFYSSDYDEYLGGKGKRQGIPHGRRRLRADFAGGTNVRDLELHCYGPRGIRRDAFNICRNRYVFRADVPEVTVTLLDRNAGEGEAVTEDVGLRQIVNFVEMHEYYTGGLSVDEIAKVAGRK